MAWQADRVTVGMLGQGVHQKGCTLHWAADDKVCSIVHVIHGVGVQESGWGSLVAAAA